MDKEMLVEVARLVSMQRQLLVVLAGAMIIGLAVLGWKLTALAKGLQGVAASLASIATMTAEVLRRTER